MSNKPTFITINKDGMKYGFHGHYIKEENGAYSWYIPAFDIYFSSPNFEEGDRRAVIMVKSFMNFWIKQQGFRGFVLQILKLGFKAQDDKALQQLLNRKNIDAKLRAVGKSIPAEFLDSKISSQEGELAMAV